ncbi:MAG: PH domain-containing protein [Pseudomarimonas sp.]
MTSPIIDPASLDLVDVLAPTSAPTTPPYESLHPNAVWAFRITQSFIAVIAWLPVMLVARPLLARPLGSGLAWLITLGVLVLLVISGWQLAQRRARAVQFRLDDAGLSINRGVYWQSETHIPRSRVQHTDIQRGPLDRRLGLADLLIHTAGTQMATVRLPGLADERAHVLRDALLEGHDQRF